MRACRFKPRFSKYSCPASWYVTLPTVFFSVMTMLTGYEPRFAPQADMPRRPPTTSARLRAMPLPRGCCQVNSSRRELFRELRLLSSARNGRSQRFAKFFALSTRHPAIELAQIRNGPLAERRLLQIAVRTELRCYREQLLAARAGCQRDASPPAFVREQLRLVLGRARVRNLRALRVADTRVHVARATDGQTRAPLRRRASARRRRTND